MKKRRRLSRARLRALLDYDPKTGEFRWRKRARRATQPSDMAGSLDKDGYWIITINRRRYLAHHIAWLFMKGIWCSQMIDHRDLDRSNNRWTNLRRATCSQNNANKPLYRNSACGLKGVSPDKGRWRATIYKNGRKRHLGMFATPEAAHAVYAKAARKLFGKFARTE